MPDIENNYERSIKLGIHEAKTSRRFFKNQPCNDLSERRQKAGFLGPISFKITVTKKKNSIKRKSEVEERRKKEKSNCYSLSFYNGFFGVFGRKRMLDGKGQFAGNVFKNPATYCIPKFPKVHFQNL